MKIAVLADIHAHLIGMQATVAHIERWQPDQVLVLGDIVNRGPRPRECLEYILSRQSQDGWIVTRGNHEDYVIGQGESDVPSDGPRFDMHRLSHWTYQQLGGSPNAPLIQAIKALPDSLDLPNGLRITHASMISMRDGIYMQTSDKHLRRQIGTPPPAMLCVGHTHIPLTRTIDATSVVNVGSAGMPFDLNRLPSYAQLTLRRDGWHAEIVRVDYDLGAAERDFLQSGYIEGAGALARVVLRELQLACGLLHTWLSKYEAPILQGEMTVEQTVAPFLAQF